MYGNRVEETSHWAALWRSRFENRKLCVSVITWIGGLVDHLLVVHQIHKMLTSHMSILSITTHSRVDLQPRLRLTHHQPSSSLEISAYCSSRFLLASFVRLSPLPTHDNADNFVNKQQTQWKHDYRWRRKGNELKLRLFFLQHCSALNIFYFFIIKREEDWNFSGQWSNNDDNELKGIVRVQSSGDFLLFSPFFHCQWSCLSNDQRKKVTTFITWNFELFFLFTFISRLQSTVEIFSL